MKRSALIAAVVFGMILSRQAAGQFADQPIPTRLVDFEIVIAELGPTADATLRENSTPAQILERIAEMEREGKAELITRVRFTALEGLMSTVQFGETRPVVAGRSAFARSRDGAPAVVSNFTMQQVGTLLSARPRVTPEGRILVELEIEKSGLRPAPPTAESTDPAQASVEPPRTSSINSKTTTLLDPGKAELLGGLESSGNDGRSQTLVLVVAQVRNL